MTTPTPEEVTAARHHAGQWLYRIAAGFDPAGTVPPQAVQGAWKVDADGRIVGDFIANDRFDPVCRPPAD